MKAIRVAIALTAILDCSVTFAQQAPILPQDTKTIVFNNKFTFGPPHEGAEVAAAAPAQPLTNGSGYASVKYSIGTADQKNRIQDIIAWMANALPEQFGNSSGTYTITLTVTDTGSKMLAQEPILSFQWTRERGFFFIDKTVENIQKTSWRGTLVDQMNVTADSRVRVAVEVYSQKNRSLDFDLLKKTASAFSSGALASLFPLPAAVVPVIDSIKDLANSFYANSRKDNLVDTEEIALNGTARPLNSSIIVGQVQIPLIIWVEVTESRLAQGRLLDGKFKTKPDESIFRNTGIQLAPGKSVSIVELISTSTDASQKATRAMLDAVTNGGNYGRDPANQKEANVATLCGNLYDALSLYLSIYDARAMFWAFLQRYGDSLNKATCLGNRQSALAEVGLN